MKFLQLFFALSLILFFAACGSDDDLGPNPELQGTWEVIFFDGEAETTTEFSSTTSNTSSTISSSNLDYRVTFTGTDFMTAGGYDITVVTSSDGQVVNTSESSVSGISGSGTYEVEGDQMTINGALFDFAANGIPGTAGDEEQVVTFEINADGELVITQDEEMMDANAGITTTTIIRSNSTWRRI